ncbi:tyrosine-protein kinase domain-containing protein [Nitriliruptor alkaliphilus]|uniref:tyrosine-protein kinase domain-containing protein n=1 Tax=Nitriliruptor alkaliphilus TaxID=427918 RepID=UPI0006979F50|nr:polysaccharide biosynthesis tyrosine autokinase [Nitriliruptor alkaliphilus]
MSRAGQIGAPPVAERWADGPTILESLWRYRWLVIGVTLVFGLSGYGFSSQGPPVYEATTRLYLTDPSTSNVFGRSGSTDLRAYVPQQTERVTSRPVLAAASDLLDDGASSVSSLRGRIDVDGDADLATLTVTVEDGSPERAAAIANAVAEAYQDSVRTAQLERAERAATELQTARDDLEARIADLAATGDGDGQDGELGDAAADVQIGVLTQRVLEIDGLRQQLLVDARLFGSGVEFVEEATTPSSPVAPTPRRTAAGMAVLGGLLVSAMAYWLAGKGRRITSKDDPAEVLGVPLLGSLPTYRVNDDGSLRERASLDPRTAEAYRFVYSSLDLVLRDLGARSVMITSAGPSAGKTETALQLALTARTRGREILLVDGDLRVRGLTVFLRATRTPGLLDLSGGYDPSVVTGYWFADRHHLSVLTTGPVVGDGSEELREDWFGRILPQLVADHELTLVDTPPLLAVAESATIAAYVDAVVLVVREGSTVEELERVQQRLHFVGRRLVGYIYLSPSALDSTDFDYGLVRAHGSPTGPAPVPFPAATDAETERSATGSVQVTRPGTDRPEGRSPRASGRTVSPDDRSVPGHDR